MELCDKLTFTDLRRIAVCCKDGSAERACHNSGSVNETLNSYRKYSRVAALEYICWCIVIVIIKGCLLCSKIILIAVQGHG